VPCAPDEPREADCYAVPSVDRRDRNGKLDQLFLGEVPARFLVHFIRDTGLRHQYHRLGPGERRPLAIAVERRLAPGVEQVEPLLALAVGTGVARVHVKAIGAAVDLRSAHLYQLDQAGLETAALDIGFECRHRFHGIGSGLIGIEPGFHDGPPRALNVGRCMLFLSGGVDTLSGA
jgi:hypothetical protein